ncbi:MAG: hypothetical protein QXI91_07715 [Candidatus Bathyarchaeia archaeon]
MLFKDLKRFISIRLSIVNFLYSELEVEFMSFNMRRFTVLFSAGAIILVLGFIFQWYPSSVIGGLKERLKEAESLDERNKLEGALNSWRVWQITTFQPLSSILLAVGIIVIVYSIISALFSIALDYKIVKKTEKG